MVDTRPDAKIQKAKSVRGCCSRRRVVIVMEDMDDDDDDDDEVCGLRVEGNDDAGVTVALRSNVVTRAKGQPDIMLLLLLVRLLLLLLLLGTTADSDTTGET
jgi:hypothetical protein